MSGELPDGQAEANELDEQGILGKSVHFNADQLDMLNARIDRKILAKRSQSGRDLTYIEGYTAINQANRILGYGSWDMDVEELTDRGWGFTALVTVFVKAPDGSQSFHKDVGVGLVTSEKGESKEMAVKAAVTDGMKRAFRAFGEQWGNSLYDRAYMATRDAEDRAAAQAALEAKRQAAQAAPRRTEPAREARSADNAPQRQRQPAPRPGPAQAVSDGEVEALAPSQSDESRLLDLRNQFRDELEQRSAVQESLRKQRKTVEMAVPDLPIGAANLEWIRRQPVDAQPREEVEA